MGNSNIITPKRIGKSIMDGGKAITLYTLSDEQIFNARIAAMKNTLAQVNDDPHSEQAREDGGILLSTLGLNSDLAILA